MAPAAVLWDMDGTLVDTEPYWMACEHELVDEFGGTWSEDDARSIIGFDLIDAAVVLRDRGGVDLDPHAIVERMLDGVIARVRERVPWRPGARRLLTELNELGVPCALVTMSWRRLVDAIIDELAPIRFQAVVTGDEVGRGKPDPEPYLLAADRLGVDAAECVAIEDSPDRRGLGRRRRVRRGRRPNIVPIEPAPGRVVVPTLKDVTPRDLGDVPRRARRRPRDAVAVRRHPRDDRRRRAAIIGGGALAAVAAVAIAVAAFGGDDDSPPPPAATGPLDVQAWTPYWAIEDALPELAARADALHELSPFWWRATGVDTITAEANVPADQAEQFLSTARDEGVPLVASILDGTEAGVMAGILADPAQRATHVDAIATFAADNDFDGIDIDYEQFAFADGRDTWATTRPNWVAFVEELAGAPARRRPHADGQHPVDLRRRHRVRPRLLGLRLRRRSPRTSTTSGSWPTTTRSRRVSRARSPRCRGSSRSSPPRARCPATRPSSSSASRCTATTGSSARRARARRTPRATSACRRATWPTSPSAAARRRRSSRATSRCGSRTPSRSTDGTTTCTQQREVRYVNGDGAGLRMQRAVAAGFGGVSLFAFGYEDEATWNAINAISRQLAAATTTPSHPPPADRPGWSP